MFPSEDTWQQKCWQAYTHYPIMPMVTFLCNPKSGDLYSSRRNDSLTVTLTCTTATGFRMLRWSRCLSSDHSFTLYRMGKVALGLL